MVSANRAMHPVLEPHTSVPNRQRGFFYSPCLGRPQHPQEWKEVVENPGKKKHQCIRKAIENYVRERRKTMKNLCCAAIFALAVGFAGPAVSDQVKVNIVYPINGATYPITAPGPGVLNSAFFTSSFSVTCPGAHTVKWGFDGLAPVGSSTFYDQTSIQFVHKLPGGNHLFWVKADCAENKVQFRLGH